MQQQNDNMILLVVLMLLLIVSGVLVFSGFFEDDPGTREKIKVLDECELDKRDQIIRRGEVLLLLIF